MAEHMLGPSIASGATPSISALMDAIAEANRTGKPDALTTLLRTDNATLLAAAKATNFGGGLHTQAQWADDFNTIIPVADPLAALLNPMNIPQYDPLNAGGSIANVGEGGTFYNPIQQDLVDAIQRSQAFEIGQAAHIAFGLPGEFQMINPADIPSFHTGGVMGETGPAILAKGEGIFTQEQMAALGAGGGGPLVVKVMLNEREIGEAVISDFRQRALGGGAFLPAEAIVTRNRS